MPEEVRGRALAVRKLRMLPVECVVRGYLSGSGWKDYQDSGGVCGIGLPDGLRESDRLPEPIFTPATKAEIGDHDENIDFESAVRAVGDRALAERLRDVSLEVYQRAADHARERGIIVADTKFEFGLDDEGQLVLGDEVLTPDSSRFWPADGYEAGRAAQLRQAVRPRLGVGHRLGQVAAGSGAAPGGGRRHARALRRGLRAHRRRAVPGLARGAGGAP